MNESLFRLINNLAGRWSWLDDGGIWCAGVLVLLIGLAVLVFCVRPHRPWYWWRLLIVAFASAGVGWWIMGKTKQHITHPRPFTALPDVTVLIKSKAGNSFPSGHATAAAAMATSVFLYNRRIGYVFLTAAGLVGVSRIFVGVHWPLDIIGGIVLGATVACACFWLLQKSMPAKKNPKMSEFQKAVLRAMRLVPLGQVVSYGQVAAYIGAPLAARQVGGALRSLAGAPDFPWWRVLNNQGVITIKDAWHANAMQQKELLQAEGVVVDDDFTLDIERYRFHASAQQLAALRLDPEYVREVLGKYNNG